MNYGIADLFEFTDLDITTHGVGTDGISPINGIMVNPTSAVSHTIDSYWRWRYTVEYGLMQSLDGISGIQIYGDVNNIGNGTIMEINEANETVAISYHAIATPGRSVLNPSSGDSDVIDDDVAGVYIDPNAVIATYSLTTPLNPVDGQEIVIDFGGIGVTGSAQPVVTSLIFQANTGQTLLGTIPSTATTDTEIRAKFRNKVGEKIWYIR